MFDLYKAHQDAELLESYVQQDFIGTEEAQVPAIHASASEGADGKVRITLANLSANESQSVCCTLSGGNFSSAAVRCLSGRMNDYNSFEDPYKVQIQTMPAIPVEGNRFQLEAPACSVFEITLS